MTLISGAGPGAGAEAPGDYSILFPGDYLLTLASQAGSTLPEVRAAGLSLKDIESWCLCSKLYSIG